MDSKNLTKESSENSKIGLNINENRNFNFNFNFVTIAQAHIKRKLELLEIVREVFNFN